MSGYPRSSGLIRASLVACLVAGMAVQVHGVRVSGTVKYNDGTAVAGAVVKLYDNDSVGKEYIAQTTTSSTGTYSITFNSASWDSCCFSSTRADPMMEVYIGGVLWLTTGELAANIDSDRTFNLVVTARKLSGVVFWGGTSERISGATIKAYDSDTVGREGIASTTTNSNGEFAIRFSASKNWDSCCGDSRRPDPVLEVYVGGKLWYTTPERSNIASDQFYSLGLTRIKVTGTAYWQEFCAPASGLAVTVKDDDTINDESMASGTTAANGSYSINVNYKKDGDSNWDLCCGDQTRPDLYSEFFYLGSSKGQTGVSGDLSVTGGTTRTVSQGLTMLWRGDSAPGATATRTKLQLDTVDWVEIEEYNSCTPRRIRASIIVNFQKNGNTTNTQYTKLKALAKKGIAENWSRTGARAVTLSNGFKYDVIAQVVERSSGHNVELEWINDKEYKRSNNVGSVAFFSLDPIIYYNAGFCKAKAGATWESACDNDFIDTAGHEFGHSILRAAPPIGWPRAYFGPIPLTLGQSYSWTHKGTTSVLQNALATAPVYPATGDADLMFYFRGTQPNDFNARSVAAEDDVRRMVGIAKVKRTRYSTCPCPVK